jgi:sugar phosphate isomerase/epimerase
MFRIGLNPYGLAFTVGLQAPDTPRANPNPIGLPGFLACAREIGAECVEIDDRWLVTMSDVDLVRLGDALAEERRTPIVSSGLKQAPGETLAASVRVATAVRAKTIRLGLTPVLEGARARWGQTWNDMVAHARQTLIVEAARAADAGLTIAIEDHQDFGSEELVAMAEDAGSNVGITLDTGNPFAVGEDPVAFAARAAHRIRHVHLKDYRGVFTNEGYRLVRCAIGEGAVPFDEIAETLSAHHTTLTASLEPGALEARHIRVFTTDWWRGYGPRAAAELGEAIGRLHARRVTDDELWQTPWEREAPAHEIIKYEQAQVRRSAENMRTGVSR